MHYKSPQTDPSYNAPTKTSDCSWNEKRPHQSTAPPQFADQPPATAACSPKHAQIPVPVEPYHHV